jgi:hypothetical protein
VTTSDDLIDRELMLNRFRRLVGDLLRGRLTRESFAPWEVDILVDLDDCQLESRRRGDIVRQYQRAVEKQMESSDGPPMKLSQFLIERSRKN